MMPHEWELFNVAKWKAVFMTVIVVIVWLCYGDRARRGARVIHKTEKSKYYYSDPRWVGAEYQSESYNTNDLGYDINSQDTRSESSGGYRYRYPKHKANKGAESKPECKQQSSDPSIEDFISYDVPYILYDDKLEFYPHPTIEPDNISHDPLATTNYDPNNVRDDYKERLEYTSLPFDYKLIHSNAHPFMSAAAIAFGKHYPLIIKPIHIWILFLHSISDHIDKNAEDLRSVWVNHDGKKVLTVHTAVLNPNFMTDRNWDIIPPVFIQNISDNTVNDVADLINITGFSKYNKHEEISSYISVMAAMKNYFEYSVIGITCAFPNITLDGTQNDWMLLKKKIEYILENKVMKIFGDKWSKTILPILDRFIIAYNGDIDALFWHSMVRKITITEEIGCGGPEDHNEYSGWINAFFPISQNAKNSQWNQYCAPYNISAVSFNYTVDEKMFGSGMKKVPFVWTIVDGTVQKNDMSFQSGFVGVEQNTNDFSIVPIIGWNVWYEGEKSKDDSSSI